MTTTRHIAAGAAALLAAHLLGACSAAEEPDVSAAASTFARLAADDPAGACALLAPRTLESVQEDGDGDCAKGLEDTDPPDPSPVREVTVSMNAAQVVMTGYTVFLAHFATGWKVTAAGCTRSSTDDAVPYTCTIEGS